MNNQDSFDHIVSYFKALANQSFEYNGKEYLPYDELIVTDKVFRSYSCPSHCGACCMKCSLVWDVHVSLPGVIHTPQTINGVAIDFWTNTQSMHKGKKCQYMQEKARCGIYSLRPLPCRFELFKFVHYISKNKVYARVALPGRGWALTREDGQKGNACEILPYDRNMTMSHVADLTILARWMDQFKISHDAQLIIKYLLTGPHKARCVVNRSNKYRRIT